MRCRLNQCVASLLLVLTVLTATSHAASSTGRLKVTATILPLADIVRQVGGNRVHVVTLLRPGVEPIAYQPSPVQIRQTLGTDLYVRVGSGFDTWGDNLFGKAADQPLTVTALDVVEPPGPDKPSPVDGKGANGPTGSRDPWVWLDPIVVRDRILPAVSAALTRLRPGDARYFKVNERKYFEALTNLDRAMWPVFRQLPGKGFVATHAIWGYMAKRYGLHQVTFSEPSSNVIPSQQNMDSLAETARNLGIVAVFGDPWSKVSPARAFADRINGRFMLLDPLGGEQFPGRQTYSALMNYNLAIIKNALK